MTIHSAINSCVSWDGLWSFLSPTLSGVITGLVLAGIVYLYKWWRDKKLARKLREAFSQIGTHLSRDSVGVVLNNKTHIPVTIREVKMLRIATADHPEKPEGASVASLVLNHAGPSEFVTHFDESTMKSNIRNFVLLPAYTGGIWEMKKEGLRKICEDKARFSGCRITIEYLTLFKTPKLLEISLDEQKDSGASEVFNGASGL